MFGYILVNKPELKVREYNLYRSFYCGLCHELSTKYGLKGQLSLSYEMTFLTLLLTGLYEPKIRRAEGRCVVHPLEKHVFRENEFTDYAADMNVLLTYYKCLDDWKDEKDLVRRGYAGTLGSQVRKIELKYPLQAEAIRQSLEELAEYEKNHIMTPDAPAGTTGHMMSALFLMKDDNWKPILSGFGFYLGKFLYLLDAFDDVEKDIRKGNYNIFKEKYYQDDFEEYAKSLMTMMMAQACREYEKLPILRYKNILDNILYSGVWTRFLAASKRRRKENAEKT